MCRQEVEDTGQRPAGAAAPVQLACLQVTDVSLPAEQHPGPGRGGAPAASLRWWPLAADVCKQGQCCVSGSQRCVGLSGWQHRTGGCHMSSLWSILSMGSRPFDAPFAVAVVATIFFSFKFRSHAASSHHVHPMRRLDRPSLDSPLLVPLKRHGRVAGALAGPPPPVVAPLACALAAATASSLRREGGWGGGWTWAVNSACQAKM